MADSKRKYDIVVFGASGVTGEYLIEELANYHSNITWCVAGRNRGKIENVLKQTGERIGKNLSHLDIIEANASDENSLSEMCQSTKLLINCVGPYRFSGEKIVEQCVKYNTNCVDVSGEPQFLESVQCKYFEEARKKRIYIVGSCGFDSIPCDMGVECLRKKFEGDLNSVEAYLDVKNPDGFTVNYATWESAIHGLAHEQELKPLRKALIQTVFPKEIPKPDYKLKKRPTLFKSNIVNGWCLPFIGSDKSVIARSQMFNHQFYNEKPVQIQTYMRNKSLLHAIVTIMMGAIFMLMAKFTYGRYFLERFPEFFSLGVFSRTPPKRELAAKGSFKITLRGQGWSDKVVDPNNKHITPPNKTLTAVIEGNDCGYITTAACVVNAAIVILTEENKLPLHGGVFTPAAAFSDTSLMDKLSSRGLSVSYI